MMRLCLPFKMILYRKNSDLCSIYQRINTVICFYIVFGIRCRFCVELHDKWRENVKAIISRAINIMLLNHLLAKAKR